MFRQLLIACFISVHVVISGPAGAQTELNPNGEGASMTNGLPGIDVDPANGAATTSISIEVPAGRNGIAPELSLRYNSSNNENGVAGYGWSIAFGAVERSLNKGTPKYNSTDEFALVTDGRDELGG